MRRTLLAVAAAAAAALLVGVWFARDQELAYRAERGYLE